MQSTRDDFPHITILGDSTIDNKIWIGLGIFGNYFYDKLGFTRDDSATRIKKARAGKWLELSVVEHLTNFLPNYHIHDYSNDGFTTGDCLQGAYKDKVFQGNAFTLFPHVDFKPLVEASDAIKKSQYVILSIGGNDFREFLVEVNSIADESEREVYIREHFESVFTTMQEQYLKIYSKIREINAHATFILMTQYYPSIIQKNYQIYERMRELGHVLGLGNNSDDPFDVIHALMKKSYLTILHALRKKNIIVLDVTSSLNPFDAKNHTHQIEPSGEGGKKIATMLKTIILTKMAKGKVYQFTEDFFVNERSDEIKTFSINKWAIRHPYDFISLDCHVLLDEIYLLQKKAKTEEVGVAIGEILRLGKILLQDKEVARLKKFLPLVMDVLVKNEQNAKEQLLKEINCENTFSFFATHKKSFFKAVEELLKVMPDKRMKFKL